MRNRMSQLFRNYVEASDRGVPVVQILDEQEKKKEAQSLFRSEQISRREFLRMLGLRPSSITALSLPVSFASYSRNEEIREVGSNLSADVRIAIIGAGIAGIRCANVLFQRSLRAEIYEASERIGGRIFSDTRTFTNPVERGGEFISSEHIRMRNLVDKFELKLEVVNGGSLDDGEDIYLIDKQFYTYEDASEDWMIAWKAFREEVQKAPWLQTYNSYTKRGRELDNISIPEWFDPSSPYSHPILAEFGPDSSFAKLCYTNAIAEYGGDHDVQPALNLLYMLAWNGKTSLSPFAGTDEQYHIEGGNHQIVQRLAENFKEHIHLDVTLEGIVGEANGPYKCHFADGSTVTADKLVLALPFRILRKLDIDSRIMGEMRPEKQLAIREMPMGTNAKIHLELSERTWGPGKEQIINGKRVKLNGSVYTNPEDIQSLWDASVPVTSGNVQLTYYPGGAQGASLVDPSPFGEADIADVERVLASADLVFPGTRAAYTGKSLKSFWFASPWQKGSYSYWGIGHYTRYLGSAAESVGNIHFAGEHTSTEFSGYMEGGLQSGSRCAQEILKSI